MRPLGDMGILNLLTLHILSDGSTVSIHSREEDGTISNATYVFRYTLSEPGPGTNGSQVQSNPHEAIFDPSGEFLFVPDRGADLLYVYHVASSLNVTIIQTLRFEPGTGPRHVTFRVFNETRTYMYLISELDNSIRVFTVDGVRNNHRGTSQRSLANITINLTQRVSTLGANLNRTSPNNRDLAAEVALSNDGRFAYASNRNTVNFNSDTVAIYSVHPGLNNDRNHLRYLGYNLTYGKTPRHFSLSKDPQTRYAAFGNEVSNNLVILERSELTGFFTEIKGNLSVGTLDITQNSGPTAIIWSSV
jgi:6-phosphogluconolactonase (cycloisomerase 2 family)